MRQSMNLGIGLILIVSPGFVEECKAHLASINETYYIIGKVV